MVGRVLGMVTAAVMMVGCGSAYPDTPAGRYCRWALDVCGRTALYPTTQSCLDDHASTERDRTPACLTALRAFDDCMIAAGSASCSGRPTECEDEYAAITPVCASFFSPLGI